MSAIHPPVYSKSDELLELLRDYEQLLVVMHDNPDPDAIASGWGVQVLIEEKLGIPTRLVAGGAIVRAENRHMVDLLQPPLELVDDVDIDQGTAIMLVDCAATTTNHLVTRKQLLPVAVIDHHQVGDENREISFVDIRPNAAASASIVASYLNEQHIEVGGKLATAMLYAFRSETRGHETHFSPLDREMLAWLTEQGEPALLAEIENAPLPRDYFADLLLALQNTFVYVDAAVCFLPQATGAEIVGEVADMLVRCENVTRVLCAAIIGEDLLLSARTSPIGGNATKLLEQTLEGLGSGGGHNHRAGGKICGVRKQHVDTFQDDLRARWLATCNVHRQRGTRLISKSQIISHLNR